MDQLLLKQEITELRTAATIAAWRWRQQRLLLLLTALGTVIATALICALPLFSTVMSTAGLRATLRADPTNAQIETRLGLSALSSSALASATQQVSAQFTRDLASYVQMPGDLATQFEVPDWLITGNVGQAVIHAASMRASLPHLQVLQGRLPADDGTGLEVALTQSAALYMHVHPGSDISLLGEAKVMTTTDTEAPPVYPQTLLLHVVGIFQTMPGDAYWQNQTFQEPAPLPHLGPVPFHILISSGPFLRWVDALSQQYQTRGISFAPSSICFLTYTLSTEHLSSTQLDDLLKRLGQLQANIAQMQSAHPDPYSATTAFPYIAGVGISGAALHDPLGPELLETFQNEMLLGRTTLLILTLEIVGLMLFFMSMLAQAQVERQASAIALLRSRGASAQQVLATLTLQGLILCLLASCLAPLLALIAVRLLAPLFLPSMTQDALNILPSSFFELLKSSGLYALAALLILLGSQIFTFIIALRGNVLTLRRETTRATSSPLWLRLRLDLVLAVLALGGYGFSFYTQEVQQLLSNQSQLLVLTPLHLLAPLLLLLACTLFLLRLLPWLLRFALRLVTGRRGAPSLLAVAQIARAPRQPARLTLLLGLALAFAVFTLIFAASQGQRAQDLATYQAGADFSGYLPLNLQTSDSKDQQHIAALYRALPGVTAVSMGFAGQEAIQVNPGSSDEAFRFLQVHAIDPQTFAQTARWAPQTSIQPLPGVLAPLVSLRRQALQQKMVPALLSQDAWQILRLHRGESFHIFTSDGTRDPITYLAVASVEHIPPANASVESGMLVDFATLQSAYVQRQQVLPDNYIWLKSTPDPVQLAHLRKALSSAPLSLNNLADWRILVQINATNPLVLNLLAVLSVGMCSALLLALLANLLLPILGMRARLTSFAFLRALGARPVQVVLLLTWEQGCVLIMALVLGTLLGLPLALVTVPSLIVNSIPATAAGTNAVYLTQALLPARVVIPGSLLGILLVLLALCLLALLLMGAFALRLTLSQQIRLNED